MGDKWALPKIILLFLVSLIWLFSSVQLNNTEEKLIHLQKTINSQNALLQELGVTQKNMQQQFERIGRRLGQTSFSEQRKTRSVQEGDGRIKSDGRNCLLDVEKIPDPFPEARDSDTLNLVLEMEIKEMNGFLDNSGALSNIENLVKMSLYGRQFMQDGRCFYTGLAKSLEVLDDYKTYIVQLRDDFFWHLPAVDLSDRKFKWILDKGRQPVTAHDFVFSVMDIIFNPDTECDVPRTAFKELDHVEALDDYTLKIVWKKKTYQSLTASALSYVLPKYLYSRYENGKKIPKEVLGSEFNRHWYNDRIIGCGPYRFVRHEKGKRIVLERDESYPLKKPHFRKIVYHYVTDADQQLLRFLKGEVDYIELRANQYGANIHRILKNRQAQEKSPFIFNDDVNHGYLYWQKVDTPGYSYVGWNQNREMFKDRRVRMAMTLAMPIEKLQQDVWMGLARPYTGPLHDGSPDYDKSLKPHPFDLQKAARLLEEAGWQDRDGNGIREKKMSDGKVHEFSFDLMHFSPMAAYDQMFAVYRKKLLKIGVKVRALGLDWPNMTKRLEEKNFDAVAMSWLLGYDTDPYQIWYSAEADNPRGSNRIGFKNKEVDDIILTARKTFDPEKRRRLFHRWHRIFYEEQPYTIWRGRTVVFAWNKRLGKIRIDSKRPQINILEWFDHGR
jgi:ABC-type transport system substrate-binding protein